MAALEGEAMLLGIWKSVEELEGSISLQELEFIVKTARDAEYRNWKFQASLKGVDLGDNEDAEDRFEEIKRRAEAKIAGISEEQLEMSDLGLDFIEE